MATSKQQHTSTKNAPGKQGKRSATSNASRPSTMKNAPGKSGAARRSATSSATKSSTAKSSTAKRSTTGSRQSVSGARPSKTNQGRQGAGPAPLRPIRQPQTRNQIIATVAADSHVERSTVQRVARCLAQTLQRHLIRNGSGRAEIPYFGGVIYRGQQAAQKARTMLSPLLGRDVQVPARRAKPVPRFRAHPTLREIVARV